MLLVVEGTCFLRTFSCVPLQASVIVSDQEVMLYYCCCAYGTREEGGELIRHYKRRGGLEVDGPEKEFDGLLLVLSGVFRGP